MTFGPEGTGGARVSNISTVGDIIDTFKRQDKMNWIRHVGIAMDRKKVSSARQAGKKRGSRSRQSAILSPLATTHLRN